MKCISLLLSSALLLTGCMGGARVGEQTQTTRSTEDRLYDDVRVLSVEYEQRNANNRGVLNDAGVWVGRRLGSMGYAVDLEQVNEQKPERGFNVVAELRGTTRPDEIIVIGAHYDAELNTPGADDNASGVAAMLELARRFAGAPMDRTVRWVGFTNEESSNSHGGVMGSFAYARAARNRNESVVAMMSLEMLGYYDDAPGSQRYPFDRSMAAQLGMDLPDTGDFIGVVGRFEDRGLELVAKLGAVCDISIEQVEQLVPCVAVPRAVQQWAHAFKESLWL